MNRFMGNKKAIAVFILPSLFLFGGLLLVSIGFSVYYSTLEWSGIGEGTFIGAQNYFEMLQDVIFQKSVKNSMLLAVLTLLLQLPFALFLALILTSGIKGEGIFRTIYFIPVTLSTVDRKSVV